MSRAAKRERSSDSQNARVEAMRLLGKWTTLAQGHVLVGAAGCSCGLPASSMAIRDFEDQILDYLRGKYAAARTSPTVRDLLRAIAAGPASDGEALALLADLARTLDSFENLHRAG